MSQITPKCTEIFLKRLLYAFSVHLIAKFCACISNNHAYLRLYKTSCATRLEFSNLLLMLEGLAIKWLLLWKINCFERTWMQRCLVRALKRVSNYVTGRLQSTTKIVYEFPVNDANSHNKKKQKTKNRTNSLQPMYTSRHCTPQRLQTLFYF